MAPGLFALVLGEHADEAVDLARVVAMVLVHDLVEIDAGDTFAYDEEGYETKARASRPRPTACSACCPPSRGASCGSCGRSTRPPTTADARFANALDRLQPVLLNHAAGADAPWVRHGVTYEQIVRRNAPIAAGSEALWAEAHERITDAVAQGWVADTTPPADSHPV